jgi:hypothetical protein
MVELGLQIKLPGGTNEFIGKTRNNFTSRKNDATQREKEFFDSDDDSSSPSDIERSHHDINNGDILDEDREIMPFSPTEHHVDDDVEEQEEEEKSMFSDDDDYDNLDDISLSPPSNLPVILIDIEKLCGYKPADEDEAAILFQQIRNSLLGPSEELDVSISEDQTAFEYIERSNQLFEERIARHGTDHSIPSNKDCSLLPVNYPEFLPLKQDDGTLSLVSTARLWKSILYPHPIKVVQNLLTLLSDCSRDIIWKYHMCLEIRNIAKDEKRWKDKRQRRDQLRRWRLEKRPAELEKLYDAREMFQIRLATSQAKYNAYCQERDLRVQNELRRRAEKGRGSGGIAGLDWDTRVTFGFGDDVDDVVSKMMQERLELDNDDNDGDQQSSHDEGVDSFDKIVDSEIDEEDDDRPLPITLDTVSGDQNFSIASSKERERRRLARSIRKKKKTYKKSKSKEEDRDLRKKIEQAYLEEASVREMYITPDERMAHSVVLHLQSQIEKIDRLLEALQEEQWQDEEEGVLDFHPSDDDEKCDHKNPSILDPILAMILSAHFIDESIPIDQHYKNLELQHREIISEWKKEFGRLPYMPTGNNQQKIDEILKEDDRMWEQAQEDIKVQLNDLAISKGSEASQNESIAVKTNFVPDNWDDLESEDDGWDDVSVSSPVPNVESNLGTILRPGGRTH